ncbi:MAG TPA: hypothetical protein VFO45_10515 [Sphingomicrobium sp.]|nr:hypothetical protein [Sphingomicrobium sp.]
MSEQDRLYFAQRAEEEERLASEASSESAAIAHRRLQRAYVERASVGDRPGLSEDIDA